MRKLIMSLLVLGGLALAGAAPASANAAAGLATKQAPGASQSVVEEARWHRRHRGWRRGGYRRHRGFSFGIGVPGFYGFYGYPRYGYRRHYRRHYYGGGYGGYGRRRHHGWY